MLHEEDGDRSSPDQDADVPAPAAIEPDDVWEEAESDLPPPSLSGAWWRGAVTGVRWTTFIIGPIAAMMLFPGLLLIEFGLSTGHGTTGTLDDVGAIGWDVDLRRRPAAAAEEAAP